MRAPARFVDTTPEQIAAMVRSNVIGSMNAARVAIAGMRRQGGGRLYLTLGGGGASGRVVPGMSVCSTTKRAVKYFADALVRERRGARRLDPGRDHQPGREHHRGHAARVRRPDAGRAQPRAEAVELHRRARREPTPWIVGRIPQAPGDDITWLTTGRLLRRGFSMLLGGKRDVLPLRTGRPEP